MHAKIDPIYCFKNRHNEIPMGANWGIASQLFGPGGDFPIASVVSAPMHCGCSCSHFLLE